MSVTAVVGAQWGDEGKGRVVDLLAQKSELVVRFQGGNNAGHTVVNDHGTFRLHHIPSGIFNGDCWNIISAGCVINPGALLEEMAEVCAGGASCDKLVISERAQVVMPYHIALDGLDEQKRSASGSEIGTTKKGIGPCYTDKYARVGLQMGDLLDGDWLRERVEQMVATKNELITQVYGGDALDAQEILATLTRQAEQLAPHIQDTLPLVHGALDEGRELLLEGQLGALRDVDWGTYPYVTSSSPTTGGAAVGAGIPPQKIERVIGVAKAYTTAVGAGPFPAELHDVIGDRLRQVGHEFGATTGRPRRCGWFDALAVRHAAMINGFTSIALTKLDVLDGFDEIRVCIGYQLGEEELLSVPTTRVLERVEPVYETLPGWSDETKTARSFGDLPANAQRYVERLEELVGVPIEFVSVGAERSEMVVR